MFAPLPSGFAKLAQAVESLGAFSLSAPPEIEELGVRMRRCYAQARERNYKGLGLGKLRRLPYALWVAGEPYLKEIEPELVREYWETHLPTAVMQPRAAKRWLAPLLYVYCHQFNRNSAQFQEYALLIRHMLRVAKGPAAEWLSGLQADQHWFEPDAVGRHLGQTLARAPGEVRETILEMNLWSGFLEEPVCSEAFTGALNAPDDVLSRETVIERLLKWATSDVRSPGGLLLRYPEHRPALADGVVRPWLFTDPPGAIRHRLTSFLVKAYGDPRTLSRTHQGHRWQGASPETLSTVKRWLVGDTLRGFMRLLQLTADDIWRYRERFWMAYYEQGLIEEAWLALGPQAVGLAKRELAKAEWAQYGTLVSGAAPDQSVLFMRIGHIVFTEWSHNGSLRACKQDDPVMPGLYSAEYHGTELREVPSMDFHGGQNSLPQLMHQHSDKGTWQRKARDFIADHTGVRLNDQAIIG